MSGAVVGRSDDWQVELQRVVDRWRQLPVDHAHTRMPVVRSSVQHLADAVAQAEGRALVAVPDLGPAVVMDQLTVVAYDAEQAGVQVAADLAALRRTL